VPRRRKQLLISDHAVRRFIQRVRPVPYMVALSELELFAARATARPTPRHWTRRCVRPSPGLRFLYAAASPGICLLVRDSTVVTVVTRQLCLPATRDGRPERRPAVTRPHEPPRRARGSRHQR
jgi:hypothetical protein